MRSAVAQRVVQRARDRAGRLRDAELVEDRAEAAAVLGAVDRLRRRAQDRHARALQRVRELQRRLAAELHEHPAQVALRLGVA